MRDEGCFTRHPEASGILPPVCAATDWGDIRVRSRPTALRTLMACVLCCLLAAPSRAATSARAVAPDRPPSIELSLALADQFAQPTAAVPGGGARERLAQARAAAARGALAAAVEKLTPLLDARNSPLLRYRAALLASTLEMAQGRYASSAHLLAQAVEIERDVRDRAALAAGRTARATLLLEFGHPEDAAASLADPSLPVTCPLAFAQARVQLAAAASPAPAKALDEAIARCRAEGDRTRAALLGVEGARQWIAQRPAMAARLLEQQLRDLPKPPDPRLVTRIHHLQAEAYAAAGRPRDARDAARAIAALDGGDAPPTLALAHRLLHDDALARGDIPSALHHYEAFHRAEVANLSDVRSREIAYREAQSTAVERERELEVLARRQRELVLAREIDRGRAHSMRLTILLVGVMTASIGYWAWSAHRAHHAMRGVARVDPLTGVATRQHFEQVARATLDAASRQRTQAALLLIDLDRLKQVNDTCGHAVGDCVLRAVARTAQGLSGARDLVGRLGGDEFAMLLPGRGPQAALELACRLRQALDRVDHLSLGCPLPLSASVGLACTPESGYGYELLVAEADRSMYAAKRAARRRGTGPGAAPERLSGCA